MLRDWGDGPDQGRLPQRALAARRGRGRPGALYYVAIGCLFAVLCLSANTSFVDFPRLCRPVAATASCRAVRGGRTAAGLFGWHFYLASAAGLLLFVFGGITDRLIPLFAIGAFLTFTLSQAGMVVHWSRGHDRSRRTHLLINATGTLTTGAALVVIVVAKFMEGAWVTVIIIPAVVMLLKAIHGYYVRLERKVRMTDPLKLSDTRPPIVLVVTDLPSSLVKKGAAGQTIQRSLRPR